MFNDIEVCSVCHFCLPRVFGYVGTIKCHCGKIVYTTENYSFNSNKQMCTGFSVLE